MKKRLCSLVILVLTVSFFARPASAIVLGQIDTFEDGTTMSWSNGAPGALLNINTGGPAGAGDNYIQITADGEGQGGRLTTFNLNQWLGNYVAQGVTRIELDLFNPNTFNLSIRLAFKSENDISVPGYLSLPVIVQAGGGWQHFSISLLPANLIAVGGPSAYNTFFSTGIGDVRIIHEVGTSNLNGDFIVGMVGIDNIRAVPEPTTMALVSGSLIVFGAFLPRIRRRPLRR